MNEEEKINLMQWKLLEANKNKKEYSEEDKTIKIIEPIKRKLSEPPFPFGLDPNAPRTDNRDNVREEHLTLKPACEWIAFGWGYLSDEGEVLDQDNRDRSTDRYKSEMIKALAKLTIAIRKKEIHFLFRTNILPNLLTFSSKDEYFSYLDMNDINLEKNTIFYKGEEYFCIDFDINDLKKVFGGLVEKESNDPQARKKDIIRLAKHYHSQGIKCLNEVVEIITKELKLKYSRGLSSDNIKKIIKGIKPELNLKKKKVGRPCKKNKNSNK